MYETAVTYPGRPRRGVPPVRLNAGMSRGYDLRGCEVVRTSGAVVDADYLRTVSCVVCSFLLRGACQITCGDRICRSCIPSTYVNTRRNGRWLPQLPIRCSTWARFTYIPSLQAILAQCFCYSKSHLVRLQWQFVVFLKAVVCSHSTCYRRRLTCVVRPRDLQYLET